MWGGRPAGDAFASPLRGRLSSGHSAGIWGVLCRAFRVLRLDVFGSAAQGTFRAESSDLDFVARFDGTRDGDYAERFFHFAEELER